MKIDDIEILARIEQEESAAYGINDSALAGERADALKHYLCEPYGNEVEGRSQVVTSEVADTVEAALPQLLKIFVSGDQVVTFNPKNAEDVEGAEQEGEYISHLVMERNPGYEIFYTWFKDALLQKQGYVKVWHEVESEVEREFYQGLTDAQLQMLVADDNVTVVEHTAYPDPVGQQQVAQMQQQAMVNGGDPSQVQVPMLHDVRIEVSEERGCIKVQNVAPENMMVSNDTKGTSLQESRFVQHRELMSRSELDEQFDNVPDDLGYTDDNMFNTETIERDLYNEDRQVKDDILVKDTYLLIDGERWRYVVAGNTVIFKEQVEIVPFVSITPVLMPHRHVGRSYADMTMTDQKVSSTLLRGMLDAMYLANSPRFGIDATRVNLEDMLVSRPGGLVRVQGDPSGAIFPLMAQPANPVTFNLIELLNANREKRTGVTSYNQGLDADSLNKTKGGMQMIMNAAQERLLNVARLFAETGVKELFMLVHRLVRMHYTKPDIVRLRNQWVEVDPRQWKTRTDMTVSVGLGTGNKDQQLQHLMSMLQVQKEALQIGVASPENVYYTCIKLTQNAGFKDAEKFWTNPSQNPQPEKPDPEQQKLQGQMQIEQMKLQADQQKFQAETVLKQQEAEKQLQQEQLRSQNDIAIEREKISAQMELERFKAQLKAETDLAIAQINAHVRSTQMMGAPLG